MYPLFPSVQQTLLWCCFSWVPPEDKGRKWFVFLSFLCPSVWVCIKPPQTVKGKFRGGSRILVRGQQSFDPRGGAEPKICSKLGFPLKIAWKLHDCEKILGAQGAGPLRPPWIRLWNILSCAWSDFHSLEGNQVLFPESISVLVKKVSHFWLD